MIVVQTALLAVAVLLVVRAVLMGRAAGRMPHGPERQARHLTAALLSFVGCGVALASAAFGVLAHG